MYRINSDNPEIKPNMALPTGNVSGLDELVRVPQLRDIIKLESHLRRLDCILAVIGWLDSEGTLVQFVTERAKSLIMSSFSSVDEVHDCVEDLLLDQQLEWKAVKKILLKQFASRSALSRHLRESLDRLHYKDAFTFTSECRRMYLLHRKVYNDKTEIRELVRTVLQRLPKTIGSEIIRCLTECDPIDWETSTPFYSADEEATDILSLIERAACNHHISNELYGSTAQGQRKDSLRIVEDWLTEWLTKYQTVLYCRGVDHEKEVAAVVKQLKDADSKTMKNREGVAFTLLGFNDKVPPRLNCYVRPYRKN